MQRVFFASAAAIGIDPFAPLSERSLGRLIVDFVATHKHTTIHNYLAAVREWHLQHGFGDLPSDSYSVGQARLGIRNVFGVTEGVTPKRALRVSDLQKIRARLNLYDFDSAAFWCALSFAFFGLLRIGEYTNGRLRFKHVSLDEQGILLSIPISKGSLRPAPVRLVPRADELCPVVAWFAYCSHFADDRDADDPCFIFGGELEGKRASSKQMVDYLKRSAAQFCGLDPSTIAGHSLRRGGTTEMFLRGVSEAVIQKHGRWRGMTKGK